ncbi:GntP family permease [Pseudomonas sp. JUb52]|nr:GntP family permease [Pseudomonas sp. JUb52]
MILLPVLLMLGSTLAKVALDPHSGLAEALKFLGEPLIALGLAVLAATVLLGWGSGMPRERGGGVLRKSLAPIAALLLTIGAGGGLKQTLLDAVVSHTVAKVAEGAHLPYILLAWLIAVALRQATGSATVATTTAGILAPVVAGLAGPQASMIALAIGAGAVSSATSTTPASGWCASTSAWSSSRTCGSGRYCRRWFPPPASWVRYCCPSGSS